MLNSNEFYLSILRANWWQHMRGMSVTNFFNHTIDKIPIVFWIFILYPAVQLEAKQSSVFVIAFEVMPWRGFALGISKANRFLVCHMNNSDKITVWSDQGWQGGCLQPGTEWDSLSKQCENGCLPQEQRYSVPQTWKDSALKLICSFICHTSFSYLLLHLVWFWPCEALNWL